jgi:predicted acetyltransferase
MKAQLILPSVKYKDSYLSAVREYKAENLLNYRTININDLEKDFEKYIEDIKNQSKGIGLPQGHVPHTVFWLVDDEGYIGKLDLRHYLNDYLKVIGGHIGYNIRPTRRRQGLGKLILKLGLEEAKKRGIKEVVITCDVDNVASSKIIEANGGQFEDFTFGFYGDESNIEKKRFKINIK